MIARLLSHTKEMINKAPSNKLDPPPDVVEVGLVASLDMVGGECHTCIDGNAFLLKMCYIIIYGEEKKIHIISHLQPPADLLHITKHNDPCGKLYIFA